MIYNQFNDNRHTQCCVFYRQSVLTDIGNKFIEPVSAFGLGIDMDDKSMDENWHRISYIKDVSNGMVWAQACAESGSPWFSGHFPNEPILPGIAILAMVVDAIRHHEAQKGVSISIAGIKRVRFKLPVRPDELINLSLSLSQNHQDLCYYFTVELNMKTVCTGMVVAQLQ